MSEQPPNEPLLSDADWERATDTSLPEGVFKLQDSDGNWWRYPLREFEEGGQR